MEKIGVFCASKEGLPAAYGEAAVRLGRWIGETRRTLVYGGSRCGLMEILARAVKEHGGRVFGVVPRLVSERGLTSEQIDVTFYCEDLTDRKATLQRESDILVALPGGIGTLDEVFTVLASHTIGYDRKRVVLYNVDGFWAPLVSLLEGMERQHLADPAWRQRLPVADTWEQLVALLSE